MQFAALDQSTLALWFNPTLLATADNSLVAHESLRLALGADLAQYTKYYRTLAPEHVRASTAIASSIWHEKRHFLDLVLTNYGAFKWRQFFLVSSNTFSILHGLKSRVAFPLTAYQDAVRRHAAGVETPPQDIAHLVSEIVRRDTIMGLEARQYGVPPSNMEMGGQAQLEALAFLFQMGANQQWLGPSGAKTFFEEQGSTFQNLVYRWAELCVHGAGLLPTIEADDMMVSDVTLLVSILYASLMMRAWAQPYAHPGLGTLDVLPPYPRLQILLRAFKGTDAAMAKWSVRDAWALVNERCRELFGRTAVEELSEDFAKQEEWVGRLEKDSPATAVAVEFTSLRGRLISAFKTSPEMVLDVGRWSTRTLPQLQPLVVFANPSGVDGHPPAGMTPIFGSPEHERSPWWWAAVMAPQQGMLGFSDVKSWAFVLRFLAPFAKLCIGGRRHQLMIGPELLTVENELKRLKFDIYFEPRFEFPVEYDCTETFYRLTPRTSFNCDFCRASINRGGGQTHRSMVSAPCT